MDLRDPPDILNTEVHSAQKQSKTASYVGLETIEWSDLIISLDLPTNGLPRYVKDKILHVLRDHYTQVNYVLQQVIIDRVIGVARRIDYFISNTCINQVV